MLVAGKVGQDEEEQSLGYHLVEIIFVMENGLLNALVASFLACCGKLMARRFSDSSIRLPVMDI